MPGPLAPEGWEPGTNRISGRRAPAHILTMQVVRMNVYTDHWPRLDRSALLRSTCSIEQILWSSNTNEFFIVNTFLFKSTKITTEIEKLQNYTQFVRRLDEIKTSSNRRTISTKIVQPLDDLYNHPTVGWLINFVQWLNDFLISETAGRFLT